MNNVLQKWWWTFTRVMFLCVSSATADSQYRRWAVCRNSLIIVVKFCRPGYPKLVRGHREGYIKTCWRLNNWGKILCLTLELTVLPTKYMYSSMLLMLSTGHLLVGIFAFFLRLGLILRSCSQVHMNLCCASLFAFWSLYQNVTVYTYQKGLLDFILAKHSDLQMLKHCLNEDRIAEAMWQQIEAILQKGVGCNSQVRILLL